MNTRCAPAGTMQPVIISHLDQLFATKKNPIPLPLYVLAEDHLKTMKRYHDELTRPASSIRGHIVNLHLSVGILAWYGVPIYDLQVLAFRRWRNTAQDYGHAWNADWVVKNIYERLERSNTVIQEEIQQAVERGYFRTSLAYFTVDTYRRLLIKTLKYIENLQLSFVDWNRVEVSASYASAVFTNPTDSLDFGFPLFKQHMIGSLRPLISDLQID